MTEKLTFIFGILYLRYLIIAGLFFWIFYKLRKKKILKSKIQLTFPKLSDYQREIAYSTITTLIFAIIGLAVFQEGWLREQTQIYDEISEMGLPYFIFSLFAIVFTHDTYFYWTHRLMHGRIGMKYIHRVHHKSTNPSPWAAFAFHPLEAIVEAGIIVVVVFLFPVHYLAVIFFMLFMTVYNVYGHLGWELYPANFHKTRIGKWVNTSVSHNQHHKYFEGNYGLYFLFWDRWMGTLRNDYDLGYSEATSKNVTI
jgi:sterol desaturase/sphingolipid hydroxylase (fatty acid hydroxylase superfamily)